MKELKASTFEVKNCLQDPGIFFTFGVLGNVKASKTFERFCISPVI